MMGRQKRYRELLRTIEKDRAEIPEERRIIDVLREFEEYLSDGYGYYVSVGNVRILLLHIARRILAALEEGDETGGECPREDSAARCDYFSHLATVSKIERMSQKSQDKPTRKKGE